MKSLLQSQFWANFKSKFGWQPFWLRNHSILGLARSLSLVGSIMYLPEVTVELPLTKSAMRQLLLEVKRQTPEAICLRVDFLLPSEPKLIDKLAALGFVRGRETQPAVRQVVSLAPSFGKLLAGLKSKTRYNWRLAAKKGLTPQWGRAELIAPFYELYRLAGERNEFARRDEIYFAALLAAIPQSEIILVSHQSQPVAGALIVYHDRVATYLYGGSRYEARELMAPILLHVEVMRRAKQKKMRFYDLLASGPRYPGLTRFKSQFGGQQIEYVGAFDYPLRSLRYRWFRLLESIRRDR